MSSDENNLLKQFLDGELSAEDEQKALRQIAEDPEQRALLRMELMMSQNWHSTTEEKAASFHVPDGFTDQVMVDITGSGAADARKPGIFRWLSGVLEPKPVLVRPAWVMAGVATFLLIAVMLPVTFGPIGEPEQRIPAREVAQQEDEQLWMRFVYVSDDAESVAVAGDFSDWDTIPLTKNEINGEIVWTGLIPLSRGEYRYMFVKDDEQWVTDPLADIYREDGFGNKNAVIKL